MHRADVLAGEHGQDHPGAKDLPVAGVHYTAPISRRKSEKRVVVGFLETNRAT